MVRKSFDHIIRKKREKILVEHDGQTGYEPCHETKIPMPGVSTKIKNIYHFISHNEHDADDANIMRRKYRYQVVASVAM